MARTARWTSSLVIALASVAALAAAPAQAAVPTPKITGTFQPGETLTASPAGDQYTYRWENCGRVGPADCTWILSAEGNTYTPTMEDFGDRLRVRVTDTTGASSTSALTVNIGRPVMLTRPAILNPEYTEIEATPGTWGPANTSPSVVYEWLRCDLQGSNCVTVPNTNGYHKYTYTDEDWAKRMRVRVTATNRAGATTVVSFAAIARGFPTNYEAPLVTGAAGPGRTLTLGQGKWRWQPTVDAWSSVWLRCDATGYNCAQVATGTTYAPTSADLGARLRGMVTATNEVGTAKKMSVPTRRIGAPIATQRPVISGTPKVGQTLTVNTGTWSPAGTSYAYRWERCPYAGVTTKCTAVSTASSYTLGGDDAERVLQVRVTATNDYGTATIFSRQTGAVAP